MYKFQDLENLGEYLYNDRLPKHYIVVDGEPEQDLALKKYMGATGDGFDLVLQDVIRSLDLVDPVKCPDKFFPILFQNFGLPYFQDIPIEFHRKLLFNIGDLYMRKGTKGAIKYLGREITGLEANVLENDRHMFRVWSSNPHNEIKGYSLSKTWGNKYEPTSFLFGKIYNRGTLSVILELADSWEDGDEKSIDFKEEAFERFLWYFMPFDVDVSVSKVLRYTEEYTGKSSGSLEEHWDTGGNIKGYLNNLDYLTNDTLILWNAKQGVQWYAHYDKFLTGCVTNTKNYGTNKNFSLNDMTGSDVYQTITHNSPTLNLKGVLNSSFRTYRPIEYAGGDDTGIIKLVYDLGAETRTFNHRLEDSKLNNLYCVTNSTLWTNTSNHIDDVINSMVERLSIPRQDESTTNNVLYKLGDNFITNFQNHHTEIITLMEETARINRQDESTTNSIFYLIGSNFITNFQNHVDIMIEDYVIDTRHEEIHLVSKEEESFTGSLNSTLGVNFELSHQNYTDKITSI